MVGESLEKDSMKTDSKENIETLSKTLLEEIKINKEDISKGTLEKELKK